MTERQALLLQALLTDLGEQSAPRREAFLHARVQASLGVAYTATEITEALRSAERSGRVRGLPNADEQIEWSITSTGRHYLASK